MKTDKIKSLSKNTYVKYGLILLAGLFIGWLIFSGGSNNAVPGEHSGHTHENEAQVWTCSMHPQIKMDKPGKCPICAMDLIPLKTSVSQDEAIDSDAIQLSKEAIALANIQTTKVSRQNPVKNISLYGVIQADERLLQSQTSHVSGRIEKLYVSSVGESVRQGQTIAAVYSPELLNAQQELLEAAKIQSQPALLQAAREKLRLWKLTDEQVSKIEQSGSVSPIVEVKADTAGIITGRKVNQGDYVSQGSVLFEIANLSQIWAVFDVYESDLPFLKTGDKIDYTLQALPGKIFSGKISFISPVLDPATRTAKVRVETANSGMQIKPEMYASATIKSSLKQYKNEIVVPKSAVLWTGKRSIVYVKQPGVETPAFTLRQVELGSSLGDSYVVISGLEDGEEIVTNGVFSVDASAQLEGKRSMMNNEVSAESKHAMLQVQGNCEMCKKRIETAAKGVKGVSVANWDAEQKVLHLNFDPSQTNLDVISQAAAKVGYDTEKHKADDKVYNALPGCCKYRE